MRTQAMPVTGRLRQIGWLMLLVVSIGCSKGGLPKVIVAGEVSYKGEPVKAGEILFYPLKGTQGPVSGAKIKDGHYEVTGKGGVPVGVHRAEIRAFRVSDKVSKAAAQVAAAMGEEGVPIDQYLPAKFNTKSTLELTVDGSQSRTVKDFALTD